MVGQNPGTNHPRMLGDLRKAATRGARVVVYNPVRERGLERFADPQNTVEMLRGASAPVASHYYQPRPGGDMAVFRGIAKAVFAADDAALAAGRPSVLDRAFLSHHAEGHEAYRVVVEATTWEAIEDQSGLSRADIEVAAEVYLGADKVICTWAMGVTQHKHSVATIREMTNVMLLRGNIGRPGAGLCPVRGHSNVQGDRTVGINEKPPAALLDALEREIGFVAPRKHGHNVIGAIGAMLDGSSKAFIGLGGNFARATPDTALVAKALASCELTVHIATKLNHSHLVPGRVAYLLPCIGRTEIDRNSKGKIQIVTVEDSMSMVHGSGGINKPASPELRSEIAIIAGMAAATVGSDKGRLGGARRRLRRHPRADRADHSGVRRLQRPRPPSARLHAAQPRRRAQLRDDHRQGEFLGRTFARGDGAPAGADEGRHLRAADPSAATISTTPPSMASTTAIAGSTASVRYCSPIPTTWPRSVAVAGDRVDIVGTHDDGVVRVAEGFRLVPFDMPRGSLAGYYPELNVFVPLSSFGKESDTPTSKSVMVSASPSGRRPRERASCRRRDLSRRHRFHRRPPARPLHPGGRAARGPSSEARRRQPKLRPRLRRRARPRPACGGDPVRGGRASGGHRAQSENPAGALRGDPGGSRHLGSPARLSLWVAAVSFRSSGSAIRPRGSSRRPARRRSA